MKRLPLALAAAAAAVLSPAYAEDLHVDLKGTYPSTNPSFVYDAPYASFELSFNTSDLSTVRANDPLHTPITDLVYRLNGKTLVADAEHAMLTRLGGTSGYGINGQFSPSADHAEFPLVHEINGFPGYDFPVLGVSVEPSHPWITAASVVNSTQVVTTHPGTYEVAGGEGGDVPQIPFQQATLTISPVPEPSTPALVGGAAVLATAGAFFRKRGWGS